MDSEHACVASLLAAVALSVVAGCSCGTGSSPDAGRDAPVDAPLTMDVPGDAPGPGEDTGEDAPAIADGGIDAGEDAPAEVPDAGTDTGTDAGMDAGLAPLELFATIGDSFVRIDTTTGDATLVGPTVLGPVAKLTYDASADVIYGVIDYLSSPRLVTVDPCTGEASAPIALTLSGGTVHFVGAIDYDPTEDAIFVTLSRNGAYPGDSNEEHLARLDPATGVLTSVGDLLESAAALDGDALMLSGTLRLLADADPAPGAPIHTFWQLDVTTGAATGRVTAPESLNSIELHDGVLYGASGAGSFAGHLVVVDPVTSEVSDVGPTHTSGEFGGGSLWTLVEARARCD